MEVPKAGNKANIVLIYTEGRMILAITAQHFYLQSPVK